MYIIKTALPINNNHAKYSVTATPLDKLALMVPRYLPTQEILKNSGHIEMDVSGL